MKEKDNYKAVAEAVRIEFNKHDDQLYIVFKVIDPSFKKRIKKDWADKDIDLKILDEKLYEFEEK